MIQSEKVDNNEIKNTETNTIIKYEKFILYSSKDKCSEQKRISKEAVCTLYRG